MLSCNLVGLSNLVTLLFIIINEVLTYVYQDLLNSVDQQVVSERVDYSYDPDPFEGLHDNIQAKK